MKKFLAVAVLMGVSGTALIAQSQNENPNPAADAISNLSALLTAYEGEIPRLIKDNPYLAAKLTNALTNGLTQAQKAWPPVQAEFENLHKTYNQALQQTYPLRCKANPSQTIKGYILRKLGSRTYAFYKADNSGTSPLYELAAQEYLGHIGTGKEFVVSHATILNPVAVQIATIVKGKPAVVVCVGQ